MADSKITALTSISTSTDPANDPLVIVDVSDTSMAASGTTKKVTLNQLLGASGTATLASATITGDLTVDTSTLKVDSANNRVGIGTASPANQLSVRNEGASGIAVIDVRGGSAGAGAVQISGNATTLGTTSFDLIQNSSGAFVNQRDANPLSMFVNGSERYAISSSGVATWSNVGGVAGTAMTLNSTGLGVGTSPSYKLHVNGTDTTNVLFNGATKGVRFVASASKYSITGVDNTGAATFQPLAIGGASLEFQIGSTTQMTLDASGNLLVGTTSNPNSSRAAVKTASVTSALSLNSVTGDTAQELFVINKFDSNSTTSQVFARFTNNNGAAGSGQINGNGANACAFGSFSDARLKENIVSLPSQLANILSLRPVEFDYKDGSGHQIGFVAQEIQEVYADTVAEQNGFLTVTGWSKTEARLVSAIKELAAKVQALEAKLA